MSRASAPRSFSSAAPSPHRSRAPSARPAISTGDPYLELSARPLPSLVLLLPLIIAYEIGTLVFARDLASGTETRIIAFTLLSQFLHLFGATGRFLPALAVVGILMAMHITHGDRWRFRPSVLPAMLAESICWAVPLLALMMLLSNSHPALAGVQATGPATATLLPGEDSLAGRLVLSLGAGIYEELVFRLIGFAAFSFLLSDVLKLAPRRTVIITLLITSLGFCLYHYLGSETPTVRTFVFRTLAGIFFGVLYLTRGFGVTAGCHAIYDVLVHAMARDIP